MKKNKLIKVALKELNKNKLRSFLMMLGIIIGISTLTVIISAGLGTRAEVMELVKKFGLDSIMIFTGPGREMGAPRGSEPTTTLTLEDAEALKQKINSIKEVAPFNRFPTREVKYQDNYTSASVFAVTPEWAPVWDWYVSDGEFINEQDMQSYRRTCVIAPTVQKELFGTESPLGKTILIGNIQFEIKGLTEPRGTSPGGGDMDNRIFVPLTTFMRRMANVDYLFGIKIRLHNAKNIQESAESARLILRERHNLSPEEPDDFSIRTPTEITAMSERIAGTFDIFLAIIAGVSLIAGGIVIANIMLLSVNERKMEIGLRKTVGATSKHIKLQFFLEAALVSLSGGIFGILLGAAGSKIFETVTDKRTIISWQVILIGVTFSILVGILSGIQPANRAAMLDPIKSLRK